jgi:hypothetical protein
MYLRSQIAIPFLKSHRSLLWLVVAGAVFVFAVGDIASRAIDHYCTHPQERMIPQAAVWCGLL